MIEEVNSIVENEFNKAEKGSTEAFNPIEIFDELGLIYGDGKTEEEIQKSVNEKYEDKINEIKKDNQIKSLKSEISFLKENLADIHSKISSILESCHSR